MFQKFKKVYLSIADDIPQDIPDVIIKLKDIVRTINLLQGNIQQTTDPLTSQIQNDSLILKNIALYPNQINIVNHTLGRTLTGWQVIRNRGCAIQWDSQDDNPSPNLTLWLNSKEMSVVDILVF
jgi:hypothetical protein